MDNLIRFPSLGHPKETGYTVYASASSGPTISRSSHSLAQWAAEWPTYGDGMTQHGPDYPVQSEALGDFCASLATYLLDNPDAVEVVARHWPHDDRAEQVRFYRTVQFKEGKRRYYCPRDRKLSASDSKRHDRRWAEVTEWMDGSVSAIVALIYNHDYVEPGLIARFHLWMSVKENLDMQEGSDNAPYCNLASEKDLLGDDRNVAWNTISAFRAVDEMVKSLRSRELAKRCLECYIHNIENAAKRAAEAKSTAESPTKGE